MARGKHFIGGFQACAHVCPFWSPMGLWVCLLLSSFPLPAFEKRAFLLGCPCLSFPAAPCFHFLSFVAILWPLLGLLSVCLFGAVFSFPILCCHLVACCGATAYFLGMFPVCSFLFAFFSGSQDADSFIHCVFASSYDVCFCVVSSCKVFQLRVMLAIACIIASSYHFAVV